MLWFLSTKSRQDRCLSYLTGEKVSEVQILGPPKSGSLLVIVLSCPLIGSLSSSTVTQRPAQDNYYTDPNFGVQEFVFLKLCYLYLSGRLCQESKNCVFLPLKFSFGEPWKFGRINYFFPLKLSIGLRLNGKSALYLF